jgi:four helix bundle protein
MTVSQSILRDRSREFAKQIVLLCSEIKEKRHVSALSNQLLRSGTSIGANIHEAQYAQGTKDFISKFEIALKECHETEYWLELLFETGFLDEGRYKPIRNNCGAIRRMLISTIRTIKEHRKQSSNTQK